MTSYILSSIVLLDKAITARISDQRRLRLLVFRVYQIYA